MMTFATPLALLVSACLAGACASPQSRAPTIERGAVTLRSGRDLPAGALFDRFRDAAARAAGCPAGVASTADPRCGGQAAARADIEALMGAGYALVRVECDGYFAALARSRTRALRDLGMAPSMIDAVRELVLRALDAHAEATLGNGAGQMAFEPALVHILDHQSICTPANIRSLIRAALARPGEAAGR